MRTNIVHRGADELTYEIRGIVEVGHELEKLGVNMYWENIGDPIAKGQEVPEWIRNIVVKEVSNNNGSFGYSPTKGVLKTREFLAKQRNMESGTSITADDILFYNGLGDAISHVYTYLNEHARILGPDPAYPTHSSAEAAHAGTHHLTYNLNPGRNWLPDINDIRNKVQYNPSIAGILLINPDNPTGTVYPKRILEEIIAIAREFDLFVISDEIYANLTYGSVPMTPLADVLDGVPGIAMRGLSKEIPWPGSRCGWIEVYNQESDPMFARYVKTLNDAKMLEVCSTTLPQTVIPAIFSDKRYRPHLKEVQELFGRRAEEAHKVLSSIAGVLAPQPQGAFYYSVVFDEGVLNESQSLPIKDTRVETFIQEKLAGIALDKRFVYYVLASEGICVVPLSGMNSRLGGFRMTLLEQDDTRFTNMLKRLKSAIEAYIQST